ncbi:hypothetical protein TB2_032655 [Malus domestica]
MDDLFLIDISQRLSPLMERSILGQCDHLVHVLPHGTCPCSSRFDASMFKELSSEASKKGFPLVWRPVELRNFPAMSHGRDTTTIVNDGEVVFKTHGLCEKTEKSMKEIIQQQKETVVTEKRVVPERPRERSGLRGERPEKDPNWNSGFRRPTLRRRLRCPHGAEEEEAVGMVHLSGRDGGAAFRDAMLHLLHSADPVAVANAIVTAISKPYNKISGSALPILFLLIYEATSRGFWVSGLGLGFPMGPKFSP